MARLAGVTQPTVSRALRDAPNVSEVTKARVREAARKLGYVPNLTGRALSRGRSDRVGLIVTDLTNLFYPHVIAPVHEHLHSQGLELVLITDGGDPESIADRARAYDLCGAILVTTSQDSRVPYLLRQRGIPFVYFNRYNAAIPADTVTTAPEAGITELVQHLHHFGHRRIGAIHGPQEASTGFDRAVAVRKALQEVDLRLLSDHEYGGPFERFTGARGARQIMASDAPPTAIICGNDVIAIGALNALRKDGVRVPDEVSVTGFDDLPEAAWPLVDLSTVHFDLQAMARRAVELLSLRIAEPDAHPVFERFPTHFVPRGSTGLVQEGGRR